MAQLFPGQPGHEIADGPATVPDIAGRDILPDPPKESKLKSFFGLGSKETTEEPVTLKSRS